MIDERLDEKLVEQFPAVLLTDKRRVKIKFSPEVHQSSLGSSCCMKLLIKTLINHHYATLSVDFRN